MEKLKFILGEWFEREVPDFVERDLLPVDFPKEIVLTVTGVRGSGKTYSLKAK